MCGGCEHRMNTRAPRPSFRVNYRSETAGSEPPQRAQAYLFWSKCPEAVARALVASGDGGVQSRLYGPPLAARYTARGAGVTRSRRRRARRRRPRAGARAAAPHLSRIYPVDVALYLALLLCRPAPVSVGGWRAKCALRTDSAAERGTCWRNCECLRAAESEGATRGARCLSLGDVHAWDSSIPPSFPHRLPLTPALLHAQERGRP